MNIQNYQDKKADHNYGVDVDNFIKEKEQARLVLQRSTLALLDAGVKALVRGVLVHLPNLNQNEYKRCNNQEFYWVAVYNDGTELQQFQDGKQYHYSHIEQDKLKEIKWVSNFVEDTSNTDKRVILTIDWKTGTASLLNGFVPQDIRSMFAESADEKKLILKMVKRQSASVDIQTQQQGEVLFYNRYLLGWETADKKVLYCVEPNGFVHLWHDLKNN